MPNAMPLRLPTGRGAALVGMVHLRPLPGSPAHRDSISEIIDAARRDAEALLEGGCDALIVENMGDLPYLKGRATPETVAAMAICTHYVAALGAPVGVQVLAGANREALGVAIAAGASFVRVEGFAYAHVADEGIIEACAGELLRARTALGAEGELVAIWADVQKKHAAHAITGDLEVSALAKGSAFCGADVLIVTGGATGVPAAVADIDAARGAGLPVAVGSGVTPESAGELVDQADALIVGSALKVDGDWRNPVDPGRVLALRRAMDKS